MLHTHAIDMHANLKLHEIIKYSIMTEKIVLLRTTIGVIIIISFVLRIIHFFFFRVLKW